MAKEFHTRIDKRGIDVFTSVPMHLGEGHCEIGGCDPL